MLLFLRTLGADTRGFVGGLSQRGLFDASSTQRHCFLPGLDTVFRVMKIFGLG